MNMSASPHSGFSKDERLKADCRLSMNYSGQEKDPHVNFGVELASDCSKCATKITTTKGANKDGRAHGATHAPVCRPVHYWRAHTHAVTCAASSLGLRCSLTMSADLLYMTVDDGKQGQGLGNIWLRLRLLRSRMHTPLV